MKKRPDDLEDLVCYLECVRDSLLIIHNSLECDNVNSKALMGAVYSSYIQLDWISEAMQKQLGRIPIDTICRAGKEGSKPIAAHVSAQ